MTLSAPVLDETGPEDPRPENPLARVRRLIAHWRSQGDTCAAAGRITAATQYRNFADALEDTLGQGDDELLSVVVVMTEGEPKLTVSATTGRGELKPWMVEEVLQTALRATQARKSAEETAYALVHSLG